MGTIKIELDIPEFQNTLDINISLTKDKSGIVKPNPFVTVNNNETPSLVAPQSSFVAQQLEEKKTVTTRKKSGGNMMGSEIF